MSVTGEVGNSGRRIQAGQKETEDEESDAGEADEQWAEGFTFNEEYSLISLLQLRDRKFAFEYEQGYEVIVQKSEQKINVQSS